MQWLVFSLMFLICMWCSSVSANHGPVVLGSQQLQRYVSEFNAADNELYTQYVPNSAAEKWLADNIPLFDCPDESITRTYYFRWWTYRKHIKKTPNGYVITEFLPPVPWAGKHNTINCPAGHHFYEGRWLHNPIYLDDYAAFWFRKDGEPRRYSFWAADAIYKRSLVTGDYKLPVKLLPDLAANYKAWESDHMDPSGLFWQIDDRDGMEMSIGGSGFRATINSYMYGDALALAQIAVMAGQADMADEYRRKAQKIKLLVEKRLWDEDAKFFKVLPKGENVKLADVRELHGYTPWYFGLPGSQFSSAWSQIKDPRGFFAPYGPTTAEQRHPKFSVSYEGHECQWNGPSWPFATSVTLTAMANLLNDYEQTAVNKADYLDLLTIYAKSQHLKLEGESFVDWIDEDLNPFTGDWIARTRLKANAIRERGKDYNHSTFCDLIITGMVGLRPSAGSKVVVNPLIPEGKWDYFCLDNVLYHGHILTIIYDKTGERYHRGSGLRILADGVEIAHRKYPGRVEGEMPTI